MTKLSDIKRYWEVKYKSPSTDQWIVEILSDPEDVDDFIENIGIPCDVQEFFA